MIIRIIFSFQWHITDECDQRCQHCLAVCPQGAISIFGKQPEDSLPPPPEARALLNIPADHYTKLIVGFGYPEIEYARGVQKDRSAKTHRYTEETR